MITEEIPLSPLLTKAERKFAGMADFELRRALHKIERKAFYKAKRQHERECERRRKGLPALTPITAK